MYLQHNSNVSIQLISQSLFLLFSALSTIVKRFQEGNLFLCILKRSSNIRFVQLKINLTVEKYRYDPGTDSMQKDSTYIRIKN